MAPPRRLPPLTALRVLEAIHETGSVVAAARRLSVSHSAVSHQVKQLEAWVGRPLFVRRGRSLALTAAGESLAGVVNEAFDSIRHELDRLPVRDARTVTVSALPAVATRLLLPAVPDFAARHPDIALHLALAHADRPVTPAPDIEIGFKPREALLEGEVELLPGNAAPVAAPALLARTGSAARLLAEGPFLADEDLRMWRLWADANPHSATQTTPPLVLEGAFLLQEAALAGLGVAFCRTAFMEGDLAEGRLIRLSDREIDADWCYLLRTAHGRRADPDVALVVAWLRAAIAAP
ncbi:MAG: LysR family transcriptional regulator [Pseudomonadota bacterium]